MKLTRMHFQDNRCFDEAFLIPFDGQRACKPSDQLGQVDVSTTGNIYFYVDDEQINRDAEILGRGLGICFKSVVNPPLESRSAQ